MSSIKKTAKNIFDAIARLRNKKIFHFSQYALPAFASPKSLRLRLCIFFLLFLIIAWSCAAFFSWKESREYVDEFFDTQQLLFAKRLAVVDYASTTAQLPKTKFLFGVTDEEERGEFEDDALGFAVFSLDGKLVMADGEKGRRFKFEPAGDDFVNARLDGKKDVWRIVWVRSLDGNYLIAVGQEASYRHDMALELLVEQISPWLVLLPVLMIGFIVLLGRELTPLGRLAQTLRARTPEETAPIDVSRLPTEVLPMAESLNAFFMRTTAMFARERSFIADAAHELRTPLAGLRVQAQVAANPVIEWDKRMGALQLLEQGINRCTRLVEQLLALSRLDAVKGAFPQSMHNAGFSYDRIDLEAILGTVLQEFSPKAAAKNMKVERSVHSSDISVCGDVTLMELLLRNLLDNAIHYGCSKTSIRIILGQTSLHVENNTPIIPGTIPSRLGERFYRPPGQAKSGSGLGLSIVRRIAEIHNFKFAIQCSNASQGEHGIFRATLLWG